MIQSPIELLHAHGLKSTPARLHVIGLLSKSSRPLTLEEIAQGSTSECDLATVYRTITTLLKKNIIKKIFTGKDVLSYELTEHHHHHIVCTQCDVIEHIDACAILALSKRILLSSSSFSKITDHTFELFGVCKACTEKNTLSSSC